MKKATGWVLTIVSILCVASVGISAVLLGRMAGMRKQLDVLSTAVTAVQQGESTILSRTSQDSANKTGGGLSNATTNSVNSTTGVNSTNATNSASGIGNSTGIPTQMTARQAEAVAAHIPAIKNAIASDPNLTAIPQGTSTSSNGYIYITIEYADKMSSHISALYWIDVRADGLVRNHMTQGAWVQPSQLTLSY